MIDKMNGQLNLCQRLRAIDARTVASSVIRSHFLPDLRESQRLWPAEVPMSQMWSFLPTNATCRSLHPSAKEQEDVVCQHTV